MADDRELVYSSETGYQAPPKSKRAKGGGAKPAMPNDGVIRVARERRRASVVSLVHGLGAAEIDDVAKALKRHCGTGGTSKHGVVEIQGDHRDKIVAWFIEQGRKAKAAGG
ncbi:MAG: stress response translation initiation inhibitor YciH [Candidatus Eremiobacteraeota bacterium]|nr:stress response translation initiation inhibitor YciH [Candidatus Eremiobacteraeota bacterium]